MSENNINEINILPDKESEIYDTITDLNHLSQQRTQFAIGDKHVEVDEEEEEEIAEEYYEEYRDKIFSNNGNLMLWGIIIFILIIIAFMGQK